MTEAFDLIRIEPREFVDAGDEVVVLATFTAWGRGSGVQRRNEDGYGVERARGSSGSLPLVQRPGPGPPSRGIEGIGGASAPGCGRVGSELLRRGRRSC